MKEMQVDLLEQGIVDKVGYLKNLLAIEILILMNWHIWGMILMIIWGWN